MAAKTINYKDAKKFVTLLAARLKKDDYEVVTKDLETHFKGAVSSLPECDLKSVLDQDFKPCLKHFVSVLQPKKKDVKVSTVLPDQVNVEADSCQEDTFAVIERRKRMTTGCHTKKSICECLDFFIRELSPRCESCIAEPSSNERAKKAVTLKDCILETIVVMHLRRQACQSEATNTCNTASDAEQSYEDLMAALLSLYVDMLLITAGTEEDNNKRVAKNLANIIFLVLGHSSAHCMDVFLQVTSFKEINSKLFMPLIRCILDRNKGALTKPEYIKFICLGRLGISKGRTDCPEASVSIRQIAESQGAPLKFVSWLGHKNRRLVERLRLSRKMSSNHVTRKLIGEQGDNDMEALLDIATETIQEDKQETEEDAGHPDSVTGEGQPLFFIDASVGSQVSGESKEVEYEEHEGEDKILHTQLQGLIGKLSQDSDSEEEDGKSEEVKDWHNIEYPAEVLFRIDTKPDNINREPPQNGSTLGNTAPHLMETSDSMTESRSTRSGRKENTKLTEIVETSTVDDSMQSQHSQDEVKSKTPRTKGRDKRKSVAVLAEKEDGEEMTRSSQEESCGVVPRKRGRPRKNKKPAALKKQGCPSKIATETILEDKQETEENAGYTDGIAEGQPLFLIDASGGSQASGESKEKDMKSEEVKDWHNIEKPAEVLFRIDTKPDNNNREPPQDGSTLGNTASHLMETSDIMTESRSTRSGRKENTKLTEIVETSTVDDSMQSQHSQDEVKSKTPRTKGRDKRKSIAALAEKEDGEDTTQSSQEESGGVVPQKRGRPRKEMTPAALKKQGCPRKIATETIQEDKQETEEDAGYSDGIAGEGQPLLLIDASGGSQASGESKEEDMNFEEVKDWHNIEKPADVLFRINTKPDNNNREPPQDGSTLGNTASHLMETSDIMTESRSTRSGRKENTKLTEIVETSTVDDSMQSQHSQDEVKSKTPRTKGRDKRKSIAALAEKEDNEDKTQSSQEENGGVVPRKRGRPRKEMTPAALKKQGCPRRIATETIQEDKQETEEDAGYSDGIAGEGQPLLLIDASGGSQASGESKEEDMKSEVVKDWHSIEKPAEVLFRIDKKSDNNNREPPQDGSTLGNTASHLIETSDSTTESRTTRSDRKENTTLIEIVETSTVDDSKQSQHSQDEVKSKTPRTKGRDKRKSSAALAEKEDGEDTTQSSQKENGGVVPRKRGRPRKQKMRDALIKRWYRGKRSDALSEEETLSVDQESQDSCSKDESSQVKSKIPRTNGQDKRKSVAALAEKEDGEEMTQSYQKKNGDVVPRKRGRPKDERVQEEDTMGAFHRRSRRLKCDTENSTLSQDSTVSSSTFKEVNKE